MIGKNRTYTTNLASNNINNFDEVGLTAYQLNLITQRGIPVTAGYILNSRAFDDFIISNNLIEEIMSNIESVDINKAKTLKKASEKIRELVLNAEIPLNIEKEILESYKNISGFSESIVKLTSSPINEFLDETNYQHKLTIIENIQGDVTLLKAIKETWAKLFSEKAMYYREVSGYAGELSQAIVIQKTIQAEVSGKAYNYNLVDNDKNFIEIEAIYGIENEETKKEVTPDRYKLNKKTLEINEKDIVGQESMYIRGGKKKGGKPYKIDISQTWKKKQKIDDHTITNIARVVLDLETMFNNKFEINWEKDADRVFLTELTFIKDIVSLEESEIKATPNALALKTKMSDRNEQAHDPNKRIIPEFTQSHFQVKEALAKPLDELPVLIAAQGNNKGTSTGPLLIVNDLNDLQAVKQSSILLLTPSVSVTIDDLADLEFCGIITTDKGLMNINLPAILIPKDFQINTQEGELVTVNSENGQLLQGRIDLQNDNAEKNLKVESEKTNTTETRITELKIPKQEKIKTSTDVFIELIKGIELPEGNTNIDGGFTTDINELTNFAKILDKSPLLYKLVYSRDEYSIVEQIREIRDSRNRENLRNIWISVANVKTEKDLIEFKQILATKKMRRSSTFKIFLQVDNPTLVFGLDTVLTGEVDGVIIDFEKLSDTLFEETSGTYSETAFETIFQLVLEATDRRKTKVWVKGDFGDDMLKHFIKEGVLGIITSGKNLQELKNIISKAEISKLKPRKRKKKK